MHRKLLGSLWLATVAMAAVQPVAAKPAAAKPVVAAKAPAPLVVAGPLAFPSGVVGKGATVAAQVDDLAIQLDKRLAASGGIGSMLQHTLYLKDGAAQPIEVLQRFHGKATMLAPSLKVRPSVGTIVRVPEIPGGGLVMIDVVAGKLPKAGQADDFKRIPFTFGPQEIVETVGVGNTVFTSGLEAMNFENGSLVPGIDEQIEVIVAKLDTAMKKAGMTVGNMVSHNLYVTKGTDPMRVIQKFHEAARRYAPGLAQHPSVGTLIVVDGMAVPGFLLEVDAIAGRGDSASFVRVPFTEMPMDIAKTVSVDKLVFVAGMEGVDFTKGGSVSPDVMEQAAAAAHKVHAALQKSGLSIADVVKFKYYVKKGENAAAVRAHFNAVAAKLDPAYSKRPHAETLIVVEGLAGESLKFETTALAVRK